MSAQTDTEVLTALDFDVVLPCELETHGKDVAPLIGHPGDGPAVFIERGECPKCHKSWTHFVCKGRRASVAQGGLDRDFLHGPCGKTSPGREFGMTWTPIPGRNPA